MTKNRGSEWRKWDLHIHTPGSFYFKGSKPLKKMTDSERDAEIKLFIKHVNESDISAFCLMDYWNFDWYIALNRYLKEHPGELTKSVFPGMELRVESPTDYRLNIHVMLSNTLSEQELIDFKSELYISSIGKKLSDDSLCRFAQSLDDSKAKHHGFAPTKDLDEDKLLQLGSKTVEISKDSLKAAFAQIPENSGYIIMPYDTSDGLLELDWKEHPHADNYFMQSTHIFESRAQQNIDLINGKQTEENKKIFENFSKTIGKPKPCVAGSDAHRYTEYGVYPSDKITWIKADATFEGFRQILFEPQQRVRIQSARPDYKESKLVIDSVRFIPTDNKFNPAPIFLNENLNVIIGGKSSGKSILLFCIANTLLADKAFLQKAEISNKYKFRNEDPSFNFEIRTKGGFSQLMYRPEEENSIIPAIKYIPQNYLIKLAEPDQSKKGADLNKIVRDLINEDTDAKEAYDNFRAILKTNDKKRENLIDNYFETLEKISSLEQELQTKSSPDVLHQSILTNTDRVKKLNEVAGLSPSQIAEYDALQSNLEILQSTRTSALNDFKKVTDFGKELVEILKAQKTKEEALKESLETNEFKTSFDSVSQILSTAMANLDIFNQKLFLEKNLEGITVFKLKSEVSEFFLQNAGERAAITKALEPYLKNEAIKKEIEEISKSITFDQSALKAISQLTKDILDQKKRLSDLKIELFKNYDENFAEYTKIITELKSRTVNLEQDGLKIEGLIKFNATRFQKEVLEFSDGRKAHFKDFEICSETRHNLDDFELSSITNEIQKMFTAIVETGAYALVSKSDRKTAAKKIMADYFFDYWQITYKNDKLGTMSTGKASFVILMLIVGLSRAKSPILIDQPEDNLDNRSITTELVEYLRNKKIDRQIILVTHNPNIVVNADAENIIIANQRGQSDQASTSPFQFDYINGSLENSRPLDENETDLLKSMGIREHIADIVEGGEDAFKKREEKYGFN